MLCSASKKGLILGESPDLEEFHAAHAPMKDNVHIGSNIAILGSYGDIVVLVPGYLQICHCRHNMSTKGLGPPAPQGSLVGDERGRNLWTVDATLGRERGERDRNMRPGWIMSWVAPGSLGVSPSRVLTAKTGCLTLHYIEPSLAHVALLLFP